MSAISHCRSAGNRGRPRGRDFQRQNSWKPCPCHRMSVSGLTTINSWCHSISRDSTTSAIRVASSARWGLACSSTYNASYFLRNRFSAASWARECTAAETSDSMSPVIRMTVRTVSRDRDRVMGRRSYAKHCRTSLVSRTLTRPPVGSTRYCRHGRSADSLRSTGCLAASYRSVIANCSMRSRNSWSTITAKVAIKDLAMNSSKSSDPLVPATPFAAPTSG